MPSGQPVCEICDLRSKRVNIVVVVVVVVFWRNLFCRKDGFDPMCACLKTPATGIMKQGGGQPQNRIGYRAYV